MDSPRIIGRLTDELDGFLRQWRSPSPFVTAHTSGSTGEPKQIELLKEDMIRSAESTCRRFAIGPGSLLGLPLSAGYIAGKMMVVRAAVSGATLWVEEPSSRPFAAEDVPQRIDLAAIVPGQAGGMLESVRKNGLQVSTAIVGGAPLSPETERMLLSSGVDCYATYGMTETCSNVALRPLGRDQYEANPGITFATDSRGCLVVEAPSMSFRRLVTNDVVELADERRFRWIGRADNVINSGGVKLYPEDIERRMSRFLPAGRFYITSRPGGRWGVEVICVCERSAMPGEALRNEIVASLSRYECPVDWIAVDTLPRTSNGKLRRR
ncbi:MAG: AMP-binding protein [Clostridium sp.]|nr:AMP-binding protein [Clostridium sp.]